MRDGALLSWRWLNTCLPMRSSEWIPYFALLACVAFALPIKRSLSQCMSFLTFTLPVLSSIPTRGEWASGCVVLSCLLGLNHNTGKRQQLQIRMRQKNTLLDPQRNDVQCACVLLFTPADKASKWPPHVSHLLFPFITNSAAPVLQSAMCLTKRWYGATQDLGQNYLFKEFPAYIPKCQCGCLGNSNQGKADVSLV